MGIAELARTAQALPWVECGMSLNIKTEITCEIAGRLAKITGESMTGAVTEAVRERLAGAHETGLADRLLPLAGTARPA